MPTDTLPDEFTIEIDAKGFVMANGITQALSHERNWCWVVEEMRLAGYEWHAWNDRENGKHHIRFRKYSLGRGRPDVDPAPMEYICEPEYPKCRIF